MSFTARYRSVCPECGEFIEPDDEVTWIGGEVAHADPAECIEALEPVGATCPKHFIELPRSGQCGECE